jgi:hypothetical protein
VLELLVREDTVQNPKGFCRSYVLWLAAEAERQSNMKE